MFSWPLFIPPQRGRELILKMKQINFQSFTKADIAELARAVADKRVEQIEREIDKLRLRLNNLESIKQREVIN